MVERARRLTPEVEFRQGDMLALDVLDECWAGITASYSIIHIPRGDLRQALGELRRALRPEGTLLLAFHIGDETVHLDETWGQPVCVDFFHFRSDEMARYLREAGFEIEEIIERDPYPPDVEHQSRRSYLFARRGRRLNLPCPAFRNTDTPLVLPILRVLSLSSVRELRAPQGASIAKWWGWVAPDACPRKGDGPSAASGSQTVASGSDTVAGPSAVLAPHVPSLARRRLAWPELGLGLLLVALTAGVYGRAVRFDFLIFDEPAYVTDNFYVLTGLSLPGVRWALRTVHDSNWIPLTWLSLMLDATLYGRWAGGFRATNLVLHAANVLLVFALFKQATGRTFPSAFVAALFAVHPLHVESVVWIAERKDVLSIFFGLLSLGAYVRYAQGVRRRTAWWVAALVAMACSLASKQTLVTLPCVLLLLDFWPLGRWSAAVRPERRAHDAEHPHRTAGMARLVVEKIPFFILSAVCCGVAVWAQSRGHSVRSLVEMPLPVRAWNAIVAYALYLERAFAPVGLAIFYPHPGAGIGMAGVALAGATLVAISVFAAVNARRLPFVLVGWLWFLGTLVPMIGLVQIGLQRMADRYAYFPNLGLYLAVAWLAPALLPSAAIRRRLLPVVAGGLVSAAAALTFVQVGYWREALTLMRHSLAETGESAFGFAMLGDALRDAGREDEARVQYQRAVELAPAVGHLSLGVQLNELRQFAAAADEYRAAIAVDEHNTLVHVGLALALCGQRDHAGARTEFERALELDPNNLAAYAGLALLCRTEGEFGPANDYAERALAIDDSYLYCQRLRAVQLFDQGRLDEAVDRLRRLAAVAPHLGDVRIDLEQAQAAQRERAASMLR